MRRLLPLFALLLLGTAPAPPEGWEPAERVRRFPGQGLYGHINGGAELFHEFGFVELRVRDWTHNSGGTVTVEIYRMDSPRAALGIYLEKSGPEKPVEGFRLRHTANSYQLTVLKGEVFLQINSPDGDEDLLPAMVELAEAELREVKAAERDPLMDMSPWMQPSEKLVLLPGSTRLIHGPLALSPYMTPKGDDPLDFAGGLWGVAAAFRNLDEELLETRITFFYRDIDRLRAAAWALDYQRDRIDAEILPTGTELRLYRSRKH